MQSQKKSKDGPNNRPQRAALYLRVSTVYQVDRDSLPMQRQDLEAYCKLVLGISDFEVFEDAGYSGKNTDRPAYQEMMEKIRARKFSHLVVWKIDRISRNLLDFSNMYEELKRLDVTFVSKNEQFDTSNAMGEAMLKIILVFAELERGMTSERVSATMINRASNGIWNGGKIPYGYSYDKDTQLFSLNEAEHPVVKYIYDLYEDMCSTVRVSHKLTEEGYKTRTGVDFTPGPIAAILRNPWYKGTYRYNYYKFSGRKELNEASEWVVIENHHVPIVSTEQYNYVQTILDENARTVNSPGRRESKIHMHVFSNLIWCSGCGAAFVASPSRAHASGYRPSKYSCPTMRKSAACRAVSVSDTVIGEFLINYVLKIVQAQRDFDQISSPEELHRRLLRGRACVDIESLEESGPSSLFEILSKATGSTGSSAKSSQDAKAAPELKKLQAEQKKLERALNRLNRIYLYSDSPMSDSEYSDKKQEISSGLQEVTDAISLISSEPWSQTMSDADFLAICDSFLQERNLQDKKFIYYEWLAEKTEASVLKDFFHSILESVSMLRGQVDTIRFKNGLSHKFIYKKETGADQ